MADFTNDYDITTPAGTEDISQGDDRIRAFKVDLEERLEAMFYGFNHDSTSGDEATAGVKALNFKEQASIATPSADQITLAAKEAGGKAELHVKDEDGDEFQITTGGKIGGSNIELTAGKSLTGSSTSDININDKFTVAGATGNTVIAGSLNPASFLTGSGGFIDEDSMATNSAAKVCSQQSIVAYIAARIAALVAMGSSTTNDADAAAMVATTLYTAVGDGIVMAYTENGIDATVEGKVDGTTVMLADTNQTNSNAAISFPVPSGSTFQIIEPKGHGITITWQPFGTLSAPTK